MFQKIRAFKDEIDTRVWVLRNKLDMYKRGIKRKIDTKLSIIFPPKYRRAVFATFWIAGRFTYELIMILWNAAKWFEEKLVRIATYWQTVFLTRDYGRVFAAGGLFSIIMALGGITEFFIILFFLILIPFIFAFLCAGAARAVLEFIYLFFKFMPPVVWVPVVAAPLGFAALLAGVRTDRAWQERKRVVLSKNRANSYPASS